jgi:1,4-alpha-glucan branching enzyme
MGGIGMSTKLYDLMNWAEIDGIIYSEEDNPHAILGPHITEHGILIQAFISNAKAVTVKIKNSDNKYPMERQYEEGFYAVLLPRKTIPNYVYIVEDKEGTVREINDPYIFESQISEKETDLFLAGTNYKIYEKLGAHEMTLKGIEGVYFAVWAPAALRVSVVGDFNHWDGRCHQMRRLSDSGIFELFIPELKKGELYKYEIKFSGGLVGLKADPYANAAQLRPDTASIVTDLGGFEWTDAEWISNRKKQDLDKLPVSIYELHLGSWRKPDDGRGFYNYKELAPMIAEYVMEMGYTHIELMPVMEHPFDASWGYQVTGYYAPTSRYGTPEDFMYFMNYMHGQGIGVILDWVPAHFPRDTFGLSNFDGTCLYEHLDPRQGSHPHWGTLIYNYGRPEVRNFLIANALFWVEKYHADGIRMDAVASMLYLDYGKNHGEWVANMYGGNENLEAVEFLRQLSDVFKQKANNAMLIAEESTAWPLVTGKTEDDGLGFDYKWNMGWMNDFIGYMKYDPYFRTHHYGELIFSMIYAYSEKFMLVFSHDEVVHGKGSMINKMPGDKEKQFANLRVAYGFMLAHPGKKLLFMGQDIGQYEEWSEEKSVDWDVLNGTEHVGLKEYVKAINHIYKNEPALYELDYKPEGFEWINNISARENIIVFTRNTKDKKDTLLVICNFAPVLQENYKIGVPYEGKYKEIFSSDQKEYGGLDNLNKRVKQSKKDECDGKENSIRITVPPLGITILKHSENKNNTTDKKIRKVKKVKTPETSKVNLKEKLAAEVLLADEKIELEKSILAAKQIEEASQKASEQNKKAVAKNKK